MRIDCSSSASRMRVGRSAIDSLCTGSQIAGLAPTHSTASAAKARAGCAVGAQRLPTRLRNGARPSPLPPHAAAVRDPRSDRRLLAAPPPRRAHQHARGAGIRRGSEAVNDAATLADDLPSTAPGSPGDDALARPRRQRSRSVPAPAHRVRREDGQPERRDHRWGAHDPTPSSRSRAGSGPGVVLIADRGGAQRSSAGSLAATEVLLQLAGLYTNVTMNASVDVRLDRRRRERDGRRWRRRCRPTSEAAIVIGGVARRGGGAATSCPGPRLARSRRRRCATPSQPRSPRRSARPSADGLARRPARAPRAAAHDRRRRGRWSRPASRR